MRLNDRIPIMVNIPIEEADKIVSICNDKGISVSEYITNVLKEHSRKQSLHHKMVLSNEEFGGYLPKEVIEQFVQEKTTYEFANYLRESGAFVINHENDRERNQTLYHGKLDVIMPEKEDTK